MPLPANGTGSRPERDTVNTPTNQEGSAMHQPTSLGQLEVRTHDGQRFEAVAEEAGRYPR
jgi:hypothetical protein